MRTYKRRKSAQREGYVFPPGSLKLTTTCIVKYISQQTAGCKGGKVTTFKMVSTSGILGYGFPEASLQSSDGKTPQT